MGLTYILSTSKD